MPLTRPDLYPPVGRLTRGATLLALLGAVAGASADEDYRKLADAQPPVYGPIVTGAAAQALLSGGSGTRGTFPSSNVILHAHIPLNNFQGSPTSANDCWGFTSPAGREYAIIGLRNGFGYVEITDPDNPVIIGHVAGPNSLWHDVALIGPYAYGVSEAGSGIQVMDLRNIDGTSNRVVHVGNIAQGGHSSTHTILSNPDSGYLYLCGANISNGGLVAVSTVPTPATPNASPTNPVIAGAWTTDYVHEAQIVTYTSGTYAGREIAFLYTGGPANGNTVSGLDIVDVTDKANFITLSRRNYPSIRYSHQGWLNEDKTLVYLNDEIDGPNQGVVSPLTRIFNVTNLSNPTLAGTFTTPGNTSVDHNLYVRGNYIYESNYASGLRVFDATDPLAPVEIAFIDTRPENNAATYNGAWGNYPFFPSGRVIISDIERGLFVVSVSTARLEFAFPGGLPQELEPDAPTPLTVTITATDTTLDPNTVELHASVDGAPAAVIPMIPAGGDFIASLPAADCFSEVAYWVSAADTMGRAFTSPAGAPANTHLARVITGSTEVFADNFELDTGWGVVNIALTDGAWERGIPVAGGTGGAPTVDFDGSGKCWLTANRTGNADVDGGPTRVTSPVIDLSGRAEVEISYAALFANDDGDADRLTVEVSGNNGSTWTLVEDITPTGGWSQRSFNVADFIVPTAQVRVRFSATDNPNNSVTEAALDAFVVTAFECESCAADFNGDGTVNVSDFLAFLSAYAAGDPRSDITGDGAVNVGDFLAFLGLYSSGCP